MAKQKEVPSDLHTEETAAGIKAEDNGGPHLLLTTPEPKEKEQPPIERDDMYPGPAGALTPLVADPGYPAAHEIPVVEVADTEPVQISEDLAIHIQALLDLFDWEVVRESVSRMGWGTAAHTPEWDANPPPADELRAIAQGLLETVAAPAQDGAVVQGTGLAGMWAENVGDTFSLVFNLRMPDGTYRRFESTDDFLDLAA
jgi:hypothetical protein